MGTGIIRFIFHRHIIPTKMASILTKIAFFAVICISFSNAGDITELTEDCGSRGVISKVEMEDCDQDYDEECVVKYRDCSWETLFYKFRSCRLQLGLQNIWQCWRYMARFSRRLPR